MADGQMFNNISLVGHGGVESMKEAAAASETSSSRKRSNNNNNNNDDDGSKEKKQKKTKDPNAPRRPISVFMFFTQLERENVKKEIPGISVKDMKRVLVERWNKLTAEEKAPYEERALADKKRYQNEKSDYMNPQQPTSMDSMDKSDSN